jgi:hypothetical protein
MSAWQLLVVYDLRYPDAWQLALEHGRMWGACTQTSTL